MTIPRTKKDLLDKVLSRATTWLIALTLATGISTAFSNSAFCAPPKAEGLSNEYLASLPKPSTFELAKCLTPNIKPDMTVSIDKPFRDFCSKSPSTKGFTGKVRVFHVDTQWIRNNGKPIMYVLAEYGNAGDTIHISGTLSVLALVRMNGKKPELIDAMNVRCDKFTYFGSPGAFLYKPGCDALSIENSHFTESQKVGFLTAFALIDGKLTKLCEGVPNVNAIRTATAGVEQWGHFAVDYGKAKGPFDIYYEVRVLRKKFDPRDSLKDLSAETKTFRIPLLQKGKTYVADRKSKVFQDYKTFIETSGVAMKVQ